MTDSQNKTKQNHSKLNNHVKTRLNVSKRMCSFILTAKQKLHLMTATNPLSFSRPRAGRSNAVGEPDHGHARLAGAGHRDADARPAAAQAVRPHQAADLAHHDEEHHRPGHLPADRHLCAAVRRYVCQHPIRLAHCVC